MASHDTGDLTCDGNPNFAVICAFLEKFGTQLGITNIDFNELQIMLENTQEVHKYLIDLHYTLLKRIKKSNPGIEKWEKFLVRICHMFSSKDAWEIERFGYRRANLQSKIRVLKELLEMQFDYNTKFKTEINKLTAAELRAKPIGRDRAGRAFWYHSDQNYQIRVYKEDLDEETWGLVAKDRAELVTLIDSLTDSSNPQNDNKDLKSVIGSSDSNSFDSVVDKDEKDKKPVELKDLEVCMGPKRELNGDEDDENHDTDDKKADISKNGTEPYEVSEAIEDPPLKIEGTGNGEDNNCPPPINLILSDVIYEDVMYFVGEGAGVDCLMGNSKSDEETHVVDDKKQSVPEDGGRNDTETGNEKLFFFGNKSPIKGSNLFIKSDNNGKNEDEQITSIKEQTTAFEDVSSNSEEITSKSEDSLKNEEVVSKNEENCSKNKEVSSKDEEVASKNKENCPKNEEVSSKDEEVASKTEEDFSENEEVISKTDEEPSKNKENSSKNEEISSDKELDSPEAASKKKEKPVEEQELKENRDESNEDGASSKEEENEDDSTTIPEAKEVQEPKCIKSVAYVCGEERTKKGDNEEEQSQSSEKDVDEKESDVVSSSCSSTLEEKEGADLVATTTTVVVEEANDDDDEEEENKSEENDPFGDIVVNDPLAVDNEDNDDDEEESKQDDGDEEVEDDNEEDAAEDQEISNKKEESNKKVSGTMKSKPQRSQRSLRNFSMDFEDTKLEVKGKIEDKKKKPALKPVPVMSSLRSLRKRGLEQAGQTSPAVKPIPSVTKKVAANKKPAPKIQKPVVKKPEPKVVAASESSSSEDEEEEAEKPTKKKSIMNSRTFLGISTENIIDTAAATSVRQSRRLAQMKIKEISTPTNVVGQKNKKNSTDSKKQTPTKKGGSNSNKSSKKIVEVDEDDGEDDDDKSKNNKKKNRKKKNRRKTFFNEDRPWATSSDCSSDEEENEEVEEEEEDIVEEDYEPRGGALKSDHEFSPESADEEDGRDDWQPMKRARTARKEEVEDADQEEEEWPCQKCGKSDHPEWILLCDKCDLGWHCSCLRPALFHIPEGDWFCPPCQHVLLLENLQLKLVEYDKKLSKKEIEERRKERLAYVGISLENVLPTKDTEDKKRNRKRRGSSGSSSESSSEESESSEDDEPIYQLRQRRQMRSYKFNDYDEMIKSAIGDEYEAEKDNSGAGNLGRGKDIATIVKDQEEQEELKKMQESKDQNGDENDEAITNKNEDKEVEEGEKEGRPSSPIRKRLKKRRHKRKLNSLDFQSTDEDDYSDEDFKGNVSSDEEEEDEDASAVSEPSSSDDDRVGGRGRRRAVRRSTRAKTKRRRYDDDFIVEDSDDNSSSTGRNRRNPKKRRRNRSFSDYYDDDDYSDASRRRSKKHKRHNDKRKKKKNKKHHNDGGEDEEPRKKRPRIQYGGLTSSEEEDKFMGRRTRGKRMTYVDPFDSEDEEKALEELSTNKKNSRRIVSDDEADEDFVVPNEEDDEDDDEAIVRGTEEKIVEIPKKPDEVVSTKEEDKKNKEEDKKNNVIVPKIYIKKPVNINNNYNSDKTKVATSSSSSVAISVANKNSTVSVVNKKESPIEIIPIMKKATDEVSKKEDEELRVKRLMEESAKRKREAIEKACKEILVGGKEKVSPVTAASPPQPKKSQDLSWMRNLPDCVKVTRVSAPPVKPSAPSKIVDVSDSVKMRMMMEEVRRKQEKEKQVKELLANKPELNLVRLPSAAPTTLSVPPQAKPINPATNTSVVGHFSSLIKHMDNKKKSMRKSDDEDDEIEDDDLSEPPGISLMPMFDRMKARNQQHQPPPAPKVVKNNMMMNRKSATNIPDESKRVKTHTIEIAAPPQPFAHTEPQPTPSVITRMLVPQQQNPAPTINTKTISKPESGVAKSQTPQPPPPAPVVGTIRPKQFATMPKDDEEDDVQPKVKTTAPSVVRRFESHNPRLQRPLPPPQQSQLPTSQYPQPPPHPYYPAHYYHRPPPFPPPAAATATTNKVAPSPPPAPSNPIPSNYYGNEIVYDEVQNSEGNVRLEEEEGSGGRDGGEVEGDEEGGGEFGGLVSYFSSQREDEDGAI